MTKTEAAFHWLRAAIEEGRLKPGDSLAVGELTKDLGMSPTPVREALRLIQAQGLAEHQPHRGMIVARHSPAEAEELYTIRVLLEPLAAELAAEKIDDKALQHVQELHEQLSTAVASDALRSDTAELNAAWHRAVYRACGSRYLVEFMDRLWAAREVQALWHSRRAPTSVAEHAQITEALVRRDARAAGKLMRHHIESRRSGPSLADRVDPDA